MQKLIFFFIVISSLCFAQTDSMIVKYNNGTIRGYPISTINNISFAGNPTNVHDQKIIEDVIKSFRLYQNYPNPFNPSTTIRYEIPRPGLVEIKIFNIQGRLVRSLLNSFQQAGNHSIIWDSRDGNGATVASGIYFFRVEYNGTSLVKKLVHLK